MFIVILLMAEVQLQAVLVIHSARRRDDIKIKKRKILLWEA